VVAAAAIAAYFIRFYALAGVWPVSDPNISFRSHAIPVLAAVPLMLIVMMWSGLYRPRRDQRYYTEAAVIFKAVVIGLALTITALTVFREVLFDGRVLSRGQYFVYSLLLLAGLLAWRYFFRVGLRIIRRSGWNLRHVAVIGTGRLGHIVYHTLARNSWTGISPAYFISHHARLDDPRVPRTVGAVDVAGGLEDLEHLLTDRPVSGVFIALPGRAMATMPDLLQRLSMFPLDVRVVPDMNPRFLPINMTASELDGMPVLSIRESPLNGWGQIIKRTLDIIGSAVALVLFAIPMLVIAALVRFSGPGPIMFRQERMTLNGQRFKIFKFRTMKHVEAERQALSDRGKGTEAWTKHNDARVTTLGRFLRRLSLDELPQLFNVLLGEMSLVGPRPERPELIEKFKEDWRGYMLRQNVKAGITGWAQVNGLRGNTSLRKRLQYDLFYIRNWSIGFDLRILWMTIFRGFAHPNAN
jgi:Undecaprenyl-phosphate glucose phosphotransferase